MAQWLPALFVFVPALYWFLAPPPPPAADTEVRLERHRNLGKAFYENPTTQKESVAEFRQALAIAPNSARERLNYGLALLRAGQIPEGTAELLRVQKQDPKLPHTWFNLGIVYKKAGEADKAIPQLERFAQLVPDDPIGHYNLASVYKLGGRAQDALKEFARASELDPELAAPHFQLYNAYRTGGQQDEARKELARFQEIKKHQEGAAIPEDIEWNAWAEILDIAHDQPSSPERAGAVAFEARKIAGAADGGMLLDMNGDGRLHVVTWSSDGLRVDGVSATQGVSNVEFSAAGDFNNDGLPDLAVITTTGPLLLKNTGKGRFEKLANSGIPEGKFHAAVWIDYDHDYDLDLILLGDKPALFRNAGTAGFEDRTADFPFAAAASAAISGAVIRVLPDTKGFDLIVSYTNGTGTLFRDRLQGHYTSENLDTLPAGSSQLHVADTDNDSYMDVLFERDGSVWRLPNRGGRFVAPEKIEQAASPIPADLQNGGVVAPVSTASLPAGCRAADYGDINDDGWNDLLCINSQDHSAVVLTNKTGAAGKNHFIRVRLAGVKNLKTAPYSEIEVKAGPRYQKRLYRDRTCHFRHRDRNGGRYSSHHMAERSYSERNQAAGK